jgi:hypothetical protein
MENHIRIDFVYTDGHMSLSDAIYLPENHTYSEDQIEVMKKERFDNWKNHIMNPPPAEHVPPVEEVTEAPGN